MAATGLVLAAYAPISARAESITQLECLQWIVQLSGSSSQFSAGSGAADYIQWARVKGLNPVGGWQPGAALNRETLAQILVQYFRIAPGKRGSDYVRILQREGILIPEGAEISRADLVRVFGRPFMNRTHGQNDDNNNNDNPAHGHDKDGDDDDDNGIGDGRGKASPHKPPGKGKPPGVPKGPKPPDRDDD